MGANRRRKSPSPRPSPATLRNGSTAHRRAAPAAPDQFGSRGWWTRPCCCRRRLAAPHWPSQASSMDLRGQGVSIGTSDMLLHLLRWTTSNIASSCTYGLKKTNGNEEEKNSNIIICESNKHLGGVNALLGLTSNQ
ncbi:uncharacterized protein LOC125545790 isoform X1 [Triticum urartu]|uniref:uncharacterized protein LOC125545790 isoform X1 n=1 Tax=Triticum urartu TaxID=4572 RepID=UPI002043B41C|nr:uncharacterized protein LOC125545790 isoform X1 [Triticum urartu]